MKEFARQATREFGKLFLALGIWFVILIGGFGGFVAWQYHQVSEFCEDAKSGKFSDLQAIAQRHGLRPHWVDHGIPDDSQGMVTFMPVDFSMGDYVCEIHSDASQTIVSAEMKGEPTGDQ